MQLVLKAHAFQLVESLHREFEVKNVCGFSVSGKQNCTSALSDSENGQHQPFVESLKNKGLNSSALLTRFGTVRLPTNGGGA